VALGLEVEGRTFVEGEFLDTVCGIPGSRTEIVMLKPPGDGTGLELSSFVRPGSVPGSPAAMANELGLRNVAFEVYDLQAAVGWAAAEGYGLVGGIGEYEGAWRMAYVRGPEGIIVTLAERIGRASQRPHLRNPQLAATASRALPAVTSHAIGYRRPYTRWPLARDRRLSRQTGREQAGRISQCTTPRALVGACVAAARKRGSQPWTAGAR
jgi:catechol 2,3-dioxygenase-like lactoylglutathione lyase family enzyme